MLIPMNDPENQMTLPIDPDIDRVKPCRRYRHHVVRDPMIGASPIELKRRRKAVGKEKTETRDVRTASHGLDVQGAARLEIAVGRAPGNFAVVNAVLGTR